MWYRNKHKYRISHDLNEVDRIADIVSKMNPYTPQQHFDLLTKPLPQISESASVEERLKHIADNNFIRIYNSIHPQIYIFPSESVGKWRYFLYDPKHLKRIMNEDYYETLTTPFNLDYPLEEVYSWCHKQYPTALIDHFDSEEEAIQDS